MLSRRDILQATAAAAVIMGGLPRLGAAAASQKITQADLLRFQPLGQVTLLHFTDIHAQLVPLYFREPSVNIGVGEVLGLPPHLVGGNLLKKYGIKAHTPEAYALASNDFVQLAKEDSQDAATARLGGDLGWFSGDAYGTRVAEVIKGLKNGEISQPFQTEVGWHVMQLEDTRTTDKTSDLQRDQAKNMVFQRKAEDEYESYLRQIRSEAYVEIRLPGATAADAPKAP